MLRPQLLRQPSRMPQFHSWEYRHPLWHDKRLQLAHFPVSLMYQPRFPVTRPCLPELGRNQLATEELCGR